MPDKPRIRASVIRPRCDRPANRIVRMWAALRAPIALSTIPGVTFENYDDKDYGYLRIVVTAKQLRIEYHPASDGEDAKTPDDFVTVDLKTRKLVHFTGT